MVQGAKRERRRDEARTLQHGYVETSTMAKQEDTLRLRTVSRLDFGLDARSATKVSAANSRMWVYIYIYCFEAGGGVVWRESEFSSAIRVHRMLTRLPALVFPRHRTYFAFRALRRAA